ncbi:unnamed protein product [Prunus armeniaca]|uniref:Transcription factor CBF/NF-Y/archaeal histone domain-containing protein n=1 Tax=Prunus armeniaca TaxID=36596 RepID=A0A6J5W280_PRUAR|nr:unnamed protein product [Prunus armeniaca]
MKFVEFIHLISLECNEVCSKEEKRTVPPEHVLKALQGHMRIGCVTKSENNDQNGQGVKGREVDAPLVWFYVDKDAYTDIMESEVTSLVQFLK